MSLQSFKTDINAHFREEMVQYKSATLMAMIVNNANPHSLKHAL